jgi:hypothetical protein
MSGRYGLGAHVGATPCQYCDKPVMGGITFPWCDEICLEKYNLQCHQQFLKMFENGRHFSSHSWLNGANK